MSLTVFQRLVQRLSHVPQLERFHLGRFLPSGRTSLVALSLKNTNGPFLGVVRVCSLMTDYMPRDWGYTGVWQMNSTLESEQETAIAYYLLALRDRYLATCVAGRTVELCVLDSDVATLRKYVETVANTERHIDQRRAAWLLANPDVMAYALRAFTAFAVKSFDNNWSGDTIVAELRKAAWIGAAMFPAYINPTLEHQA